METFPLSVRPACRAAGWINHKGLKSQWPSWAQWPHDPSPSGSLQALLCCWLSFPRKKEGPAASSYLWATPGKAKNCSQMLDLETVNTSGSRTRQSLFAEQKPAKMQCHSFQNGICCWKEAILLRHTSYQGYLQVPMLDVFQCVRTYRKRELSMVPVSCSDTSMLEGGFPQPIRPLRSCPACLPHYPE